MEISPHLLIVKPCYHTKVLIFSSFSKNTFSSSNFCVKLIGNRLVILSLDTGIVSVDATGIVIELYFSHKNSRIVRWLSNSRRILFCWSNMTFQFSVMSFLFHFQMFFGVICFVRLSFIKSKIDILFASFSSSTYTWESCIVCVCVFAANILKANFFTIRIEFKHRRMRRWLEAPQN